MDSETQKIFEAQLKKLPDEVVSFLTSSNWSDSVNEIASQHRFSKDELLAFEREVTLTLVGLTHPDFFHDILKKEVGLVGEILDTVTKETEEKIFAPIRPMLVSFFENENAQVIEGPMPTTTSSSVLDVNLLAETQPNKPVPVSITNDQILNASSAPLSPVPPRVWKKESNIAPDNLPTGEPLETEPLIPPIPPKNTVSTSETPTHPFEEKMKRVFTAGAQSIEDLSIEPSSPQSAPMPTPSPTPTTPRPAAFDPYREPIE